MLSLKTTVNFADNHLGENGRLILQVGHLVPEEFVKTYRKALKARNRVPAKSFRLRRSVRYQVLGNQAVIQWLAPYAAAQEAGMARGRIYRNYTTPGTGRGFALTAWQDTNEQFMRDFYANHPEYGQ